jgi:transposase
VADRSLARVEKKARQERRKLVFIDESGFYLLPALVRTYAPSGETPILKVFQTKDHLSVMSGITLTGQLFTLTREEALTSCESVLFLRHLLHALSAKLLVIWDGSPIHRGVEVKEFLADGGARHVHLERLPPYAPDLNPDEGIWDLLKYVELRNVCSYGSLISKVGSQDSRHSEPDTSVQTVPKPHFGVWCDA